MRLDQFTSQALNVSRKTAKKLIKNGDIEVNQTPSSANTYLAKTDKVYFQNQLISLPQPMHFALHKPKGFVCSNIDEHYPSILRLIPKSSLVYHIAGRLDVDTTGLVIITNDSNLCHRIISPKQKIKKSKTYHVILAKPLDRSAQSLLEKGIMLKGESKITAPCNIEKQNDLISITLYEGRYHQIKRMFAAIGNHVEHLHRVQVGAVKLGGLQAKQYRPLTQSEYCSFFNQNEDNQ